MKTQFDKIDGRRIKHGDIYNYINSNCMSMEVEFNRRTKRFYIWINSKIIKDPKSIKTLVKNVNGYIEKYNFSISSPKNFGN